MNRLNPVNIGLTPSQANRIIKGVKNNEDIKIKISAENMKGDTAVLMTPIQQTRHARNMRQGRGMHLLLRQQQMNNTESIGGVGPLATLLVTALAPAVIDLGKQAISGIINLIRGSGLITLETPEMIETALEIGGRVGNSRIPSIRNSKFRELIRSRNVGISEAQIDKIIRAGKKISVKRRGRGTNAVAEDLTDTDIEVIKKAVISAQKKGIIPLPGSVGSSLKTVGSSLRPASGKGTRKDVSIEIGKFLGSSAHETSGDVNLPMKSTSANIITPFPLKIRNNNQKDIDLVTRGIERIPFASKN